MPWPRFSPPPSPAEKDLWYPLDRRLGGPQSWSGHRGYKKNPLPVPRIELRLSSLVRHNTESGSETRDLSLCCGRGRWWTGCPANSAWRFLLSCGDSVHDHFVPHANEPYKHQKFCAIVFRRGKLYMICVSGFMHKWSVVVLATAKTKCVMTSS
jgi:ribosomal protein L36